MKTKNETKTKGTKQLTDPVRLLLRLLDAHERLLALDDPTANFGIAPEALGMYRHAYKHGATDVLRKMRLALGAK